MATTLLLILIYFAFISLGLPDSMLGAAWPTIQLEMDMPMSAGGFIAMIVSTGTIISSFLSGKLIEKFGTGKLTVISVFFTAFALFGFSFSNHYAWLCIMAIPLGLGAGAVDSALNNFVALHFAAKHMNWLHSFWGIGATAGPIIMSLQITRNDSWQLGYLTVAIIQIILVGILLFSLPLWKKYSDNGSKAQESVEKKRQSVFKLPGITPALTGFFAYCALEATAGLWGASFLVHTKGVAADVAAGWISMYYMGITIGRVFSGFFTAKFSNQTLIRGGMGIIALGAILILSTSTAFLNLTGIILIGLGCAPIYPSMLHETPVRFGKESSSSLMGIQMAFAYIGTTLVPPAFGVFSDFAGIQYYPIFLLLLLVLMFFGNEKIHQVAMKRLQTQKVKI